MDLTKFIEPTILDNTDNNGDYGNMAFQTKDLVFLESGKEVEKFSNYERVTYPTDYAVMNKAMMNIKKIGERNKKSCAVRLRSRGGDVDTKAIDLWGDVCSSIVYSLCGGVCPTLHLNLSAIISTLKADSGAFIFSEIKDLYEYHTMEFGEYPKTYVGDKLNAKLERLYSSKKLSTTGKTYTGVFSAGIPSYNKEYIIGSYKFVRIESGKWDDDSEMSDGTMLPKDGTPLWVEVKPIVWKIKNWEDLPKEINPEGRGTAKYIEIKTEEAIISGIPFYPTSIDTNCSMWQNSTIRGYLNGINVNNIKRNGNIEFTAPNGGNFSNKNNFLSEAFNIDLNKTLKATDEKVLESEESIKEINDVMPKKSRLDKLNPDTTPTENRRKMTDTEIIKSWIDAGQSVLLRGPSGIGKTERIKKLYPNLIYLKLTNNMFPEKVVGSMNLQTGQSIPPAFAKQALLACANDDEKKLVQENIQNIYDIADTIYERSKNSKEKVIIMLDELLNVKPAVQSLVYTLVLNKLVETGKGLKLPANTVIVATGNQKKYSNVAEDLAEPLEKRFDHILDMEPKVGEWIYEYAIPNKIHPSVIGYIFSKYQENYKSEEIKDIGYFYEEPEVGEENLDKNGCRGRTNDPRGWVSISNTLYAFEEDLQKGKFIGKNVENLLEVTIGSKLREEWAGEFFDFYNNPTLTVEDVISKKYTQADFPGDINEKFACIASLLNANMEQVGICREFIRKHCDPEYLSLYDIYWAGNDENRMEKLTELQEMSTINDGGELEL